MVTGSKWAASMSTSRVVAADLGLGAAHDAGDRDGPLAAVVGDEQVARVEGAVDVVEGGQPLAGPRAAHDDRAPARVARSNACSGWPRPSIT